MYREQFLRSGIVSIGFVLCLFFWNAGVVRAPSPEAPLLPMNVEFRYVKVKARVPVEEASDFGRSKYSGTDGHSICIETFGTSAPIKQLLKKFGFSTENIVAVAKAEITRHRGTDESSCRR